MNKPRVLVIGLDGATWDLIRPWAAAGHLPHLAQLIEEGSGAVLRSTIPPMSPAAWSSFMTGKNPGKHGVFDFTVRDFQSYDMRVTLRPSEPSLWSLLSAQGRRVCVINVPQTYPPEQVNGYVVTGLGTPTGRVFTHPVELTETLLRENYRIVPNSVIQRDGTAPFVRDVHQGAQQVTETAQRLMSESDWDFSMVVLRLTDEIPHYFWHWMDPSHPAHAPADTLHGEAVLRCYQAADELVGNLIARVKDKNTIVFVMSDHGFGPLHKDVYLNNWLREKGYLKLRSQPTARNVLATSLRRLGITRTAVGHSLSRLGLHRLRAALRDGLGRWAEIFPNDAQARVSELVDWAQTRAYSVGYTGQIYVNLIGRDPLGVVAPGAEYEQFLGGLVEQLQEMVDPEDGKRVVDQVLRKEEIYTGTFLPVAPDLLLVMRGYSYITRQSYEFSANDVSFAPPPTQETGGHRQEGVLIACGGSIKDNDWLEPVRIEDLAPTILHLLGCEVPDDMDGRVLTEMLLPEYVAANAVRYSKAERHEGAVNGFTPEEEESVLEHLRNLGYIG